MAIVTYQKTDKTNIAKNFTVAEFACKGKGCCSTTPIDSKLPEYLQKIRDHFGKKVIIASGYRCPIYNAKISNASKKSKHMQGMAADIKVDGVEPAEVAKYAESIGVKGIGLYEGKDGSFVHIDTRTTKSFWYGHAQAYRRTFGGSKNTSAATASEYTLKQFVKDIQTAFGAKVDGIAGPETLSKTLTLSAHMNQKHTAVKAVQKRLKVLGYAEIGTIDGVAGPKFTSAVAHFQQDNGCVVDGVITAKNKTWKKLLGMK